MLQDNPILSADENYRLYLKSVKCTRLGVSIRRMPDREPNTGRHEGDKVSVPRRGNIRRFSSSSALRLRRAIVEKQSSVSGCQVVAVTLTLPFRGDFFSPRLFDQLVEDYKKAFHRFTVAFCRRFPASCGIFRHELQRRRCPHAHIVFYISNIDFHIIERGRNANIKDFTAVVFGLWLNSIQGFKYDCSISGFMRKGVRVSVVDPHDKIYALRYLADHSSKHKRSQLGYKGKQWGFIRRSLLVVSPSVTLNFRDYIEQVKFIRLVRKVSRYRVKNDGRQFGNRLSRSRCVKGVYFVSAHTSIRILAAIRCGFSAGSHNLRSSDSQVTCLPP